MPELPEMETYRRLLAAELAGRVITQTEVQREKSLNVPVPAFLSAVNNTTLTTVERRGKHVLFQLHSGHVLMLHLMLGGFLYLGTTVDKLDRTAQVTLTFGDRVLYFHGLRLGWLHLHPAASAQKLLAGLGPEPLAPDFTEERFRQIVANKRGMVKTTLVDQQVIAGIGNCYADELCFAAGILPMRKWPSMQPEEFTALYRAMQSVLREAIRLGGYMEPPLYRGDTQTGGYNHHCLVYDREGEPCPRCGQPIIREELASRKVFYCRGCQH